ncbi:MAG TPA: hypothetical protein VF466_02510 [Candidatus Saccharimonadales bacterium]
MLGNWGELKIRLLALLTMLATAGAAQTQVLAAHTNVPAAPHKSTVVSQVTPPKFTTPPVITPIKPIDPVVPPPTDPEQPVTPPHYCGCGRWWGPKQQHIMCPMNTGTNYVCTNSPD